MKSCLGLLIIFLSFVAVVGGGATIWYLSKTAEFSRTDAPAAGPSTGPAPAPPRATPAPAPRPTQPKPAAPKPAPRPATPERSSSPFGDNAPPEVPR
ncbi:MAG: hypothetical protein EOP88_19865 [Verrucomicrobiaceae bacterium]|nr:MAG: hypothetical protein EOP88_19865 [Verrucomicrobiaceae bacterium]